MPLPSANPRAHGLYLTDLEWAAVEKIVRDDERIVAAWVFGSRRTGVRRDPAKQTPPDIDLALRLNWPVEAYRKNDLAAELASKWKHLLDEFQINIDWNGVGARSYTYHAMGLQIWPAHLVPERMLMLSHAAIWSAIDALAARHRLSPSGLAKRAGLDATAFNPSKRIRKDGRPRWPSTEAVARVLESTDTTWVEFAELVERHSSPAPDG